MQQVDMSRIPCRQAVRTEWPLKLGIGQARCHAMDINIIA